MSNGPIASEQLRLFIERAERVKEEIKALQDDLKDIFAEAKGQGYAPAIMKEIIKLRAMDTDKRREREALLDTYKAALGMLDGTPLGRWAVERLHKPDDQEDDAPADHPVAAAPDERTVEDARALGAAAAKAGKPVTANPFPARDVRRAAWDEAWCAELGTDGMDIPDAWKPATKKAPTE